MGYSSFSHLLRFPIDVIKIDRHFISNMASNAYASAPVVTLVELRRRLVMAVVAGGVQSEEAQGFLFHAPPSPSAFATLLERDAVAKVG